MADRAAILNQNPITETVPQTPDTLLTGIADIGAKAAEASEQSKLLMYGAQAHAAFKGLDAQFRQQYADNPGDKQGLKDLQEQRQQVAQGLGGNISVFYKRQWQEKMTDLGTQSDVSNEAWGVHQNYRNAINNTNTAMQTYLSIGNQDGQAFGASDGGTDGSNIMNFLSARDQIGTAVKPILGEKADAMMKNFDADYAKSFVAGAAERNPKKALELLDTPEIQQHFSTQDRVDMIDLVAKVQKAQQLQKDLGLTKNNTALTDIVNDPSTDYYSKRAQIDQLDMQGSITPSAAAKARRVIKSSSDLDTQTDTPVMADIINKVYDLNASATTNGGEYLRGVRNVQENILELQAQGKLTAHDASKLNKQISTLTSAKIASATQSVGLEFYDANQKFEALPPEYRGDATRQLFYAGDGKNLNPQQYGAMALGIIDSVNSQRRAVAQKMIEQSTQSDLDMLKGMNATPADVTATAQKYHISEAEVIKQLRKHRLNGSGKRMGPVTRSSGDTSPSGQTPSGDASPADSTPGDEGAEE